MQSKRSPREVRRAAGLSQIQVAVATGSSQPTVRLYEANPNAVSDTKRPRLDRYYAELDARFDEPTEAATPR